MLNTTSQLVAEALREAQRVKQYGTGGVAERAGVAKRKRKCIAYVFCRVAPTKKKYSSVVYAQHTYAHNSGNFQTRNRIENNTGLFAVPGGQLQPGYFHPRDVAADANFIIHDANATIL